MEVKKVCWDGGMRMVVHVGKDSFVAQVEVSCSGEDL